MNKADLFIQDLERVYVALCDAYRATADKLERYKTFDEYKDLAELDKAIDYLDDEIAHAKYFDPIT